MSEVNKLEIQVPEHLQGGIWSNMVAVSHSQYEFTLDFVRIHFGQPPVDDRMQAVLVQRVNVSPLLVTQLISALEENMGKYEKRFGERVAQSLIRDVDNEEEPNGGD